jgi:hypothetical protein
MPEDKNRVHTIAVRAKADSNQTIITHFISPIASAIPNDANIFKIRLAIQKGKILNYFHT